MSVETFFVLIIGVGGAALALLNWGNRTEAHADALIDAGQPAAGFALGCVPIVVALCFVVVVLVLGAAVANGELH
jgi:uncharacterized membrane protein YidH (DUF202 family)